MKSFVIVAGLFAISAIADVCNRDNVLRCLVTSSAVASPFCSSYLSIPIVTVTVGTSTPVTTISTTTVATATTSVTSTSIAAFTTPGFAKRGVPGAVWVNGVAFHPDTAPAVTARAVAAGTSPAPACLTQVSSSSYPASRISSACSCLSVSTSTKSVTATAPTVTSTAVSSTTQTTTLVTVTTTTTNAPEQTCGTTIQGDEGLIYRQYYKGSGFTENFDNPGNDNGNPQTTTFPGSAGACSALQQCAIFASGLNDEYYSFDLHYLTSQSVYECTAFFDGNNDASYFNVANADVASGVGYSLE